MIEIVLKALFALFVMFICTVMMTFAVIIFDFCFKFKFHGYKKTLKAFAVLVSSIILGAVIGVLFLTPFQNCVLAGFVYVIAGAHLIRTFIMEINLID